MKNQGGSVSGCGILWVDQYAGMFIDLWRSYFRNDPSQNKKKIFLVAKYFLYRILFDTL
jgi:hypothetical protein